MRKNLREEKVKSHQELLREYDEEKSTYQKQLKMLTFALVVLIIVLIVIYLI